MLKLPLKTLAVSNSGNATFYNVAMLHVYLYIRIQVTLMNLEFLEISLTLILLAVEVDYSQVSIYVV